MLRKSFIVFLLGCSLILFGSSNAVGQTVVFTDIKGSYAETAVNQLAEQGFVHGITASQFGPRLKINRLQFTVLMARVLGVQPLFPSQAAFTDLPPGTLETGYVEAMTRLGIVKGITANTFGGSKLISREAAAVILQRALSQADAASLSNQCQDAKAISPYAVSGVAWVMDKGVMSGSNGHFYPANNLTREEIAVIAVRILKLRAEQAVQARPADDEAAVELRVGENRGVDKKPGTYPAAFSIIYGLDSPNIAVDTYSSSIKGLTSGNSTLTGNYGKSNYTSTVKVLGGTASTGTDAEAGIMGSNVSLACQYQVFEQSPDVGFKQTEYKNYSGPVDGLTSRSETWTGLLRQQGRDIIIDLGRLQAVSSCSLEFKQDVAAGIYYPPYMAGEVSADGSCWYNLGQARHLKETDSGPTMTLSLVFPPVNIRYIKLSFPVDVFVFARHLTISGGKPAVEPVVLAPITGPSQAQDGYLSTTAFKDILLVFTGDQTPVKTLDGDDFLPLVAYLNSEGKAAGRMFDTIQFMPYTGIPCTKVSWLSYLDDLFKPGQQLNALETAMTSSGLPNKEKVILALPYPDSTQADFGSLDGTGLSLSFVPDSNNNQSLKNRLAAVSWYYGEMMQRWNSAGFKHMELAGIYWYQETMDPKIEGEAELVQSTARMVKAKGQNFIWVPYYGANGLADWRTYGFTHVFLQPNYYATQDPPADRMDQTASLVKKYNLGMELELDNRVLTTRYYYDLFYKELNKAHEQGIDGNTPNVYYVGFAKTILDMVKSDIPQIRKIYDDIYLWMNGKYPQN